MTYGAAGIRVNAIAPGLTVTEMVEDWDPGVVDRIVAGRRWDGPPPPRRSRRRPPGC